MGKRWQKRRAEKAQRKNAEKSESVSQKKIADNPSIKSLTDQAESMHNLLELQKQDPEIISMMPGFDLIKHEEEIKRLYKETKEFASVPDDFNDTFAPLGWIASEYTSIDLMKEAIACANKKNVDEAEALLVNNIDEKYLEFLFLRIGWREVFNKRMRLLELARVDYIEERYHACIPLLLALIDGIVNDLSKHVGFFAENSDVTAFDSLAGHERGLQFIAKIFKQPRKKTNEEPITLPFRNGILHGKELAFDNKIVAAKCWALISAIRDWVHSVENPKEEKKEKTFFEVFEDLKEHEKNKKETERLFAEYYANDADREYNFPVNYDQLHLIEDNTPEKLVAIFFETLMHKRYGILVDMLDIPSTRKKGAAGQLAEDFKGIDIKSFTIVGIDDKAPAVSSVEVGVEYQVDGIEYGKQFEIRLIYEDEKQNPLIRNDPRGKWVILQGSINLLRYGPHGI